MPAGGAAGSAGASAGSSTSTVSPACTRGRLGTAAPSTRTAPSSMSRWARAREPSGPARNASSRAPASSAPARRRIVALEDVQQDEHAERDRHVGDVERREAERQLHEVGDAAAARAVDDVADRAAEQHPGRQPEQRPPHVRREVDEQERERDRDDQRHDRAAAGQRAERHPARGDEGHPPPRAEPHRGSALDEADEEATDDVEHEDRDDRAEVDRAERRDEAPEDRQVRLADVAQEPEDRARPPRVRHSPAEREEHRAQDVGDDQERVDLDHGLDVAGDVVAHRGEDEAVERAHPALRMASIASENAARRPPRSSASRPRAVEPPGEVTPRRTASVSYSRRRMSSAVPAIVCTTSSDAWRAGMPLRTPASTWASAMSA